MSSYQHEALSPGLQDSPRSRDSEDEGHSGKGEKEEPGGMVAVLKSNLFLSSLLLFIPFGFLSEHLGWSNPVKFACNFFAILPMAWLIGKTTEDLASHTGEIMGGLINATFGNIVEMLLCIAGIQQNQLDIVKFTLIGSILSNMLLVMGTAFLYGGVVYHVQEFNQYGAGAHTSLMLLAVFGLILPTMFASIVAIPNNPATINISRVCSVMLLFLYCQYIFFELKTHKDIFEAKDSEGDEDEEEADLTARTATAVLAVCTILTAFCSEYLIKSIEGTIESWKISAEFIGIIILPIIGNAAEHYTAIVVAGKNKMDLSLNVAIGSSCQMAMLVTPFCVLVGWACDRPMTLDFHKFQVAVLVMSVLIVSNIINDGKSNWLAGSMLVTAYFLIATIYLLEGGQEPEVIAVGSVIKH